MASTTPENPSQDVVLGGLAPAPDLDIVLVHRSDPEYLLRALRALNGLTVSKHTLTVRDQGPADQAGRVRILVSFYPDAKLVRAAAEEPRGRGPVGSRSAAWIDSSLPPRIFGWDQAARRGAAIPGVRWLSPGELPDPDSPAAAAYPADRRAFLEELDNDLDAAILEAARRPGSPLEDVACDLCGSREAFVALRAMDLLNRMPGYWTVRRCRACGLAYTNPRPRPESILAYYPDTYGCYQPYATETPQAAGSWKARIKRLRGLYRKQLMRQHFGYYAGEFRSSSVWKALTWPASRGEWLKLTPMFPSGPGKPAVLEIGCGNGSRLAMLKAMGWKVHGVEPSQAASDFARSGGLDVDTADIAHVEFADGAFDCIIMNMVLEHLPSPRQSLQRILRWLRPGGEILIAVPDFSGFEARTFGPYHYGLQVPTHLYHFTPETLRRLFSGLDLRIRHQYTHRDLRAGMEFRLEQDPNPLLRIMARLPRRVLLLAAYFLSLAGSTSRMSARAFKG
jgi:SAM-dependent methyltransferase